MEIERFDTTNWDKIDLKSAEFFFQESEKRLKTTIETFSTGREAGYRVLGFVMPVLAISIGYLASNQDGTWAKVMPASIFAAILLFGTCLLAWAMRSTKLFGIGAPPAWLWDKEHWKIEDPSPQFVGILINYCECMGHYIKQNESTNQRFARSFDRALLICAIVAPLAYLVTFLAFQVCR